MVSNNRPPPARKVKYGPAYSFQCTSCRLGSSGLSPAARVFSRVSLGLGVGVGDACGVGVGLRVACDADADCAGRPVESSPCARTDCSELPTESESCGWQRPAAATRAIAASSRNAAFMIL